MPANTSHPKSSSLSDIFQLLGQPNRLYILLTIARDEACVCHLEAVLGIRQATISQHLMVLRDAGVVMAQIGNAFASRTLHARTRQMGVFTNQELLLAILLEFAIILILIYVRPVGGLFEHLPLPPIYWLGLGAFAPIVFTADWLRKAVKRRLTARRLPAL